MRSFWACNHGSAAIAPLSPLGDGRGSLCHYPRWLLCHLQGLLYHPALLPFAAPLRVRRLCRWSHLHGVWRRGLRCPARLVGSRAQFDSATRFSSPGDLPSSAAFSRLRCSSECLLSCARRLLSSWQGCNRAGPSSRDEAGVLQPLFHRTQGRRWYSTNPGLRLLNRALPGSRLRCWRTGAWSNAYSPGIGLQRLTWRMLTFMFRSFHDTDRSTVCVRGSGMAVQGPPLRALPVRPCLHEDRGGCPCPVTGSGHQDPQLSRAWPARENSYAITGTWCFGTSASWGFGSTGKRASSPLRRESLFLVWS